MADKLPLLSDKLTDTQRVSLASLKNQPGFAVLELMMMEACKRATEEVIKLDPIEEGYERKLKALQSKARERNEFSLLLLQSIDWQAAMAINEEKEKVDEPKHNRIVRPIKRTEQ